MSDAPTPPPGEILVAASRAARGSQRTALRAALQSGRAALQAERRQASLDAATRPPRWRPVRHAANVAEPVPEMAPETVPEPIPEPMPEPVPVPQAACADPPLPEAEATTLATDVAESIFSALVSDLPAEAEPVVTLALVQDEAAATHDAVPTEQDSEPEVLAEAEMQPEAELSAPIAPDSVAPDAEDPAPSPPVTALGPGMLARLRMVGYARFEDLATADPAALRHALGDISRLLNVEAWIEDARRSAAKV